jgi:O-antigen/teichoic acid export membrane protein
LVGLPTALVVALLDSVRRGGGDTAQGVLLVGLVLLAIVLVVAVERGVAWAANNEAVEAAAWGVAGLVVLVAVGVVVDGVGLVLVALGVVVGLPTALAGVVGLAWWRWRHGPRPSPPARTPRDEVRARAEERRAAVRARRAVTRAAVEQGYVGPGYTRGPGPDRG